MTNTLKHLALLARMESSGLKLGLTGKFPEDALDQTCERVETFQLQNRLRTGNDNTQIQKELVRTPEFAALYHALCNDGVDDRSITSIVADHPMHHRQVLSNEFLLLFRQTGHVLTSRQAAACPAAGGAEACLQRRTTSSHIHSENWPIWVCRSSSPSFACSQM